MSKPLILGRRVAHTGSVRPLPEHRYDPILCANVVVDGNLLIRSVDPALVADYTQTQEPSGLKTDD
ncbi:hypothetical protein [Embleya hyalina]|uniref:Uncharacterized protein n=1 Tax=Embleya hyalina TaxID=516124 RepID=A0A401YYU3_9ACTN|nr:hypothetical protein [Embleya hyalina]GCD99720.1 hypothetical protein EHYA_07442 [Embleya hyalina]